MENFMSVNQWVANLIGKICQLEIMVRPSTVFHLKFFSKTSSCNPSINTSIDIFLALETFLISKLWVVFLLQNVDSPKRHGSQLVCTFLPCGATAAECSSIASLKGYLGHDTSGLSCIWNLMVLIITFVLLNLYPFPNSLKKLRMHIDVLLLYINIECLAKKNCCVYSKNVFKKIASNTGCYQMFMLLYSVSLIILG